MFFIFKLSHPEIALHKNNVIMGESKSSYRKRTQKDYSQSFKLQVVQEIEQGLLTRVQALDKYRAQTKSALRGWLDISV